MVPLRLSVRNFLSYGLEGGELDLRPIHLACLSGANGNGKSALVDAITWVLWGRSRAAREDDLLRHGTSEMEVELEFAANHAVYRVIRKRALRKSASGASLELAVRDGDTYRAITGNSMADTERAIDEILRLSYETFINSSILLQGKADLFTTKRPAERKEILAEILGLGQYEVLAQSARQRERDYRSESERRRTRVAELDAFLAGVPLLQAQLALTDEQLRVREAERAQAETLASELERRVQEMLSSQARVQRLDERLSATAREEVEARAQANEASERAGAAERLLADEAALRTRLAQLQEARADNDRMGTTLLKLRELEASTVVATRHIAAEDGRLRAELRAAEDNVRKATMAEAALLAIEADLHRAREKHATLDALLTARGGITADLARLEGELGKLAASAETLSVRRKELRTRVQQLDAAGALCPTCGSVLDEARRAEARALACREGIACKEQMDRENAQAVALAAQKQRAQAALTTTEAGMNDAQLGGRRAAELEERARLLQVQAGEVEALRLRAGQIEAALKDGAFALEARQRIAVLNKEIASLGYSSEAHDAVQAHIRALLPVESELAALEHAREALQRASEARSAAHARLAALAEEKARIVEERAPLQAAILELPGLQQSLLQHRQTLRALREAEAVLQKQVGGLTSQLENARLWALEQAKEAELAADAEGQQWAHHELAAIFGKGGIPAMLIENALPELEQDTNELLARMTDNSTQVQFATQRVGTGGKAIETLEIKIADTLGTRSYEMFSGGEAFRINFAIRIAMSKLLTRNAGADLSFLLIDEGFGTQDDQGRDRLVEAITAVAEDFEKILVVTHIDELKDQFDVHVEVSKGPAGSQISVSAA